MSMTSSAIAKKIPLLKGKLAAPIDVTKKKEAVIISRKKTATTSTSSSASLSPSPTSGGPTPPKAVLIKPKLGGNVKAKQPLLAKPKKAAPYPVKKIGTLIPQHQRSSTQGSISTDGGAKITEDGMATIALPVTKNSTKSPTEVELAAQQPDVPTAAANRVTSTSEIQVNAQIDSGTDDASPQADLHSARGIVGDHSTVVAPDILLPMSFPALVGAEVEVVSSSAHIARTAEMAEETRPEPALTESDSSSEDDRNTEAIDAEINVREGNLQSADIPRDTPAADILESHQKNASEENQSLANEAIEVVIPKLEQDAPEVLSKSVPQALSLQVAQESANTEEQPLGTAPNESEQLAVRVDDSYVASKPPENENSLCDENPPTANAESRFSEIFAREEVDPCLSTAKVMVEESDATDLASPEVNRALESDDKGGPDGACFELRETGIGAKDETRIYDIPLLVPVTGQKAIDTEIAVGDIISETVATVCDPAETLVHEDITVSSIEDVSCGAELAGKDVGCPDGGLDTYNQMGAQPSLPTAIDSPSSSSQGPNTCPVDETISEQATIVLKTPESVDGTKQENAPRATASVVATPYGATIDDKRSGSGESEEAKCVLDAVGISPHVMGPTPLGDGLECHEDIIDGPFLTDATSTSDATSSDDDDPVAGEGGDTGTAPLRDGGSQAIVVDGEWPECAYVAVVLDYADDEGVAVMETKTTSLEDSPFHEDARGLDEATGEEGIRNVMMVINAPVMPEEGRIALAADARTPQIAAPSSVTNLVMSNATDAVASGVVYSSYAGVYKTHSDDSGFQPTNAEHALSRTFDRADRDESQLDGNADWARNAERKQSKSSLLVPTETQEVSSAVTAYPQMPVDEHAARILASPRQQYPLSGQNVEISQYETTNQELSTSTTQPLAHSSWAPLDHIDSRVMESKAAYSTTSPEAVSSTVLHSQATVADSHHQQPQLSQATAYSAAYAMTQESEMVAAGTQAMTENVNLQISSYVQRDLPPSHSLLDAKRIPSFATSSQFNFAQSRDGLSPATPSTLIQSPLLGNRQLLGSNPANMISGFREGLHVPNFPSHIASPDCYGKDLNTVQDSLYTFGPHQTTSSYLSAGVMTSSINNPTSSVSYDLGPACSSRAEVLASSVNVPTTSLSHDSDLASSNRAGVLASSVNLPTTSLSHDLGPASSTRAETTRVISTRASGLQTARLQPLEAHNNSNLMQTWQNAEAPTDHCTPYLTSSSYGTNKLAPLSINTARAGFSTPYSSAPSNLGSTTIGMDTRLTPAMVIAPSPPAPIVPRIPSSSSNFQVPRCEIMPIGYTKPQSWTSHVAATAAAAGHHPPGVAVGMMPLPLHAGATKLQSFDGGAIADSGPMAEPLISARGLPGVLTEAKVGGMSNVASPSTVASRGSVSSRGSRAQRSTSLPPTKVNRFCTGSWGRQHEASSRRARNAWMPTGCCQCGRKVSGDDL